MYISSPGVCPNVNHDSERDEPPTGGAHTEHPPPPQALPAPEALIQHSYTHCYGDRGRNQARCGQASLTHTVLSRSRKSRGHSPHVVRFGVSDSPSLSTEASFLILASKLLDYAQGTKEPTEQTVPRLPIFQWEQSRVSPGWETPCSAPANISFQNQVRGPSYR